MNGPLTEAAVIPVVADTVNATRRKELEQVMEIMSFGRAW